jgi:CRP-like cAMP-binding protein
METTIEKVIHLQRIEMFEDIPSEQLAHLAAITHDMRVAKGEIIFSEGDDSNSLYILIDGAVEIEYIGGETVQIEQDEAFGILGFFDREPRLSPAKAIEESFLFKIDHTDFFDLIDDRVHLSKGLIKFLVAKIRQLITETDTKL